MRRKIHLRCRNCNHILRPIKRKRRYQCPDCGKRGTVGKSREHLFQAYTSKDFKVILDLFDKEPYDLETLRIAQEIKEARERGETIELIRKLKGRKKRKKKKPGGQKKELRPGTIENFHSKYRHFKEQHPDQEPRAYMVSEWLRDGKTSKKVRDRWAVELLQKHRPKEHK